MRVAQFVQLIRRLICEPAPAPPSVRHETDATNRPSAAAKKTEKKKASGINLFGLGKGGRVSAREGRAEARLYGVVTMLRDVVGALEALLARAARAPDAHGKAELYYEGVCAALAACRRLADTTFENASTGASAQWEAEAHAEALELQWLRRELSEAKLLLAEERAAREAVEHELRAQAQAAAQRPQSRSSALFAFG